MLRVDIKQCRNLTLLAGFRIRAKTQ
jgi:hypothetical protein